MRYVIQHPSIHPLANLTANSEQVALQVARDLVDAAAEGTRAFVWDGFNVHNGANVVAIVTADGVETTPAAILPMRQAASKIR
jgi:hypothetical protein